MDLVRQDGVDRARCLEEAWHEGETHWEVVQHRIVTHTRADEGCLADHARMRREVVVGIELEDAAVFARLGQRLHERSRRRQVARHHNPGFRARERSEPASRLLEAQPFHDL